MKIAYFNADFGIPVHGNKGASIHTRELSHALQSLGHEVEIFSCRKGGDAPEGFEVPVHEIKLEDPERRMVSLLQDDPDAGEVVAKAMRSVLYASRMRSEAREILQGFEPDAIYERYSLLGTAGLDMARERGIPHILEVNAPLSEEQARYRGVAIAQTVRATEQRILAGSDQVISVSEPLKQWIVQSGAGAERVTVVPNGVNCDRFAGSQSDLRAQLGLDDRPVVGFVGTLKGWHGVGTLLRAIGRLANDQGLERTPYVLIVGDGPQRESLEAIAVEEGIADLTVFTGTVAHGDMPAYIQAMDIAVAPYDAMVDFYFSPLKLFEYMAAGRAIVAADIGQVTDVIRDGDNGTLYTPGDEASLASRLRELLDDSDLRQTLGNAARNEARSKYEWTRNAQTVIDLIDRARTGKGSSDERVSPNRKAS